MFYISCINNILLVTRLLGILRLLNFVDGTILITGLINFPG